jgi:hypothetical protein
VHRVRQRGHFQGFGVRRGHREGAAPTPTDGRAGAGGYSRAGAVSGYSRAAGGAAAGATRDRDGGARGVWREPASPPPLPLPPPPPPSCSSPYRVSYGSLNACPTGASLSPLSPSLSLSRPRAAPRTAHPGRRGSRGPCPARPHSTKRRGLVVPARVHSRSVALWLFQRESTHEASRFGCSSASPLTKRRALVVPGVQERVHPPRPQARAAAPPPPDTKPPPPHEATARNRRRVAVRGWCCAAPARRPDARRAPPSPRTNRTRRVPHLVLIGHAAPLTPYYAQGPDRGLPRADRAHRHRHPPRREAGAPRPAPQRRAAQRPDRGGSRTRGRRPPAETARFRRRALTARAADRSSSST